MKRFVWMSLMIIIGFTACNNQTNQPISNQKMAELMRDILIAENAVYRVGIDTSLHVDMFNKNLDSLALWYYSIFEQHNIGLEQFQSALTWYKAHPKEMADVYKIVIPELSELAIKYENLKRAESMEPIDSMTSTDNLETKSDKTESRKLIKLNSTSETIDTNTTANEG